MPEHLERMAVLETKLATVEATNVKILARMEEMHSDLTRFKGFAGGVLFLASAVGAFLGFIKAWLFGHA